MELETKIKLEKAKVDKFFREYSQYDLDIYKNMYVNIGNYFLMHDMYRGSELQYNTMKVTNECYQNFLKHKNETI